MFLLLQLLITLGIVPTEVNTFSLTSNKYDVHIRSKILVPHTHRISGHQKRKRNHCHLLKRIYSQQQDDDRSDEIDQEEVSNNNGNVEELNLFANELEPEGSHFGRIVNGLDYLYPPIDLSKRVSTSRSDGYWTYLEDGKQPPTHLTYGEFDFMFFAQLLEMALKQLGHDDDDDYDDDVVKFNSETINSDNCNNDGSNDFFNSNIAAIAQEKTFLDIGSGSGRLVIGTAALYPSMKLCKGIEILPKLHDSALRVLGQCKEGKGGFDDVKEEEEETIDNTMIDTNSEEEEVKVDEDKLLTNGMNKMIDVLQDMTEEEWKEILGNIDIDMEDDDMEDDASNNDNVEQNTSIVSDDNEEKPEIENLDDDDATNESLQSVASDVFGENETIDLIEKFRATKEEINPDFVLLAESELLLDETDDCSEEDSSVFFESIESFMNTPEAQLKEMLGINKKKEQDISIPILATENEINEGGSKHGDHNDINDLNYYFPSNDVEENENPLSLAPIQFSCGSFEDPYEYIGDADVVFVFSTCWTYAMMESLGKCIGWQCKPGTIVITTEYQIPLSGMIEKYENDPSLPSGEYKLELLDKIDGNCSVTGGLSTAYLHRVVSSLYEEGIGPRQKPVKTKEEIAWSVIQDFELNKLDDTAKFVRNLKNALAFYSYKFNIDEDNPT